MPLSTVTVTQLEFQSNYRYYTEGAEYKASMQPRSENYYYQTSTSDLHWACDCEGREYIKKVLKRIAPHRRRANPYTMMAISSTKARNKK